jgi:peptidoglycan hydrolase CwlO-like protein
LKEEGIIELKTYKEIMSNQKRRKEEIEEKHKSLVKRSRELIRDMEIFDLRIKELLGDIKEGERKFDDLFTTIKNVLSDK